MSLSPVWRRLKGSRAKFEPVEVGLISMTGRVSSLRLGDGVLELSSAATYIGSQQIDRICAANYSLPSTVC